MYRAFFIALAVGCYTHYYKIVQNEHFGYPQEWFPSVSATTGDRYPARAIFQILIALTSGPRFALVFLWYLYTTRSTKTSTEGFGQFLLGVGLVRTVACGGWVYITSTDDHLTHDIAMILYLVCTLPWQLGVVKTSSRHPVALRWRRRLTAAFFLTLPPMIYFFLQHKVHRIPGAYTIYAFFEWSLIIYDVAFDAVTAIDFGDFEFTITDSSGRTSAPVSVGGVSTTYSENISVKESVFTTAVNLCKSITLRNAMAEIYLGFVFWSLLTALALLIWYFPLWYMGISGYEAFLFITITPMILGIRSLRRFVATYHACFHALSLVGIASFWARDPALRLILTATGLAISLTTWSATWIQLRHQPAALERSVLLWGVGLLVHNVVKMAWWTENPIWPIMHAANGGQNITGLVLGLVACLCLNHVQNQNQKADLPPPSPTLKGRWWMASAGWGAVLFALHSMFTDSSAIMRWSVAGYPNYGPEPVPWGVATVGALSLGLLASSSGRAMTGIWWYLIGCAGCTVFYAYQGWTAFYGGLVLGAYLMSVLPCLARAITAYPPCKTLFTGFFIYNLFCLAHVWVVAYAFVPGGVYLRERSDVVLVVLMATLGLGVYHAGTLAGRGHGARRTHFSFFRMTRSVLRLSIVGVMVVAVFVSVRRSLRAAVPAPYTTSEKSFTAGIWTIHFALDNDMWASEMRIRDAIRDLQLDVVGLLESDTMRIIMGNRDWAQYIAEDLGYYLDYGPSTMEHTWGCLMLSKFPIIRSSHHLLPSPVGELACAIHATLDVYGQPVDFIVSHNGQEEDPEDRRLQTTELARIMRTSVHPFVFLGYVVTQPQQPLYHLLFDGGEMNDIDPSDWDRWCQYMGYRGLKRVAYARISHGRITDTEIQTGKFQVVDTPRDFWKASYERVEASQVVSALRYPDSFRGQGIRGHRFHVFDEPRYFVH
ncbi:Frag1/DRAM/Sfk1 family-domain-containing protein [Spinellus fusiger]|nr:Frag1/DRAM/Sfk1 family-domain-containing protein [Spinellus fusiger]